jgi:uncharacterized protein with von Willebrand factor type A (vWA) domain
MIKFLMALAMAALIGAAVVAGMNNKKLATEKVFIEQLTSEANSINSSRDEIEQKKEAAKGAFQTAETAHKAGVDEKTTLENSLKGKKAEVERLNATYEGRKAQVEEMVQRMAAEQGLDKGKKGYSLSPKAMRLFQGKLLEKIFSALDPSRTGRHQVNVTGEGAVEMVPTRQYEFGDSVAHIDIPGSLVNAMLRQGKERPLRLDPRDIEVHRTRNTPKCATVVALDMSGSMRHGGLYVSVKRMALALQGLVQREFPGDALSFLEMYSFAKPRPAGEIVTLLPKPVTIFEPVVRLRADMSNPAITAEDVPPHFTNIQHALQLARRQLARADTPNKQVILITDGLPTAHFEGNELYLLYPPHKRTEEATLREAEACRREGIVVNVFLLSGWSQSREDIQFAYKLAQTAQGRVFFTSGKDLDRFVVWDYVSRRRSIIG